MKVLCFDIGGKDSEFGLSVLDYGLDGPSAQMSVQRIKYFVTLITAHVLYVAKVPVAVAIGIAIFRCILIIVIGLRAKSVCNAVAVAFAVAFAVAVAFAIVVQSRRTHRPQNNPSNRRILTCVDEPASPSFVPLRADSELGFRFGFGFSVLVSVLVLYFGFSNFGLDASGVSLVYAFNAHFKSFL